jgi:adenine-specific DNA-methyltransferase
MELFATDLAKLDFLLEAEALAAEEVVSEELPPEKRPKYITNYIGSKQKLVDWIWRNTPDDVKSVFDAFSGSAVVGYMYKTKGIKVITNDRLRFAYHAARAIIENNNTRLSADDIKGLVKDNSKAGNFVQKTFKGIFFSSGVHRIIDNIRANIDELSGYKKDIALFALGRACLSGKGGFGHFSATEQNDKRSDSPKEFIERFQNLCNRINALVFDNGKENKAYNQDIMELAPKVKADLAYFDPPYATHFSTTNYEKSYHFLEGLMTYWKGLEIDTDNKARNYVMDSPTVTQANAQEFFSNFLSKSKQIKYWLISYRDQAYPSEAQLKKIISAQGKASRMKSKDHHYSITSKHGEASHPKEHLFVCTPKTSHQSSVDSHQSKAEAFGDLPTDDIRLTTDDWNLLCTIAGKTDSARAEPSPEPSNILVTGYIGNKHFIMEWMDKHMPKGVKSIFDAFTGGVNVAYFYKRKGLQVFANDIMHYPYHIARAIIENNSVTLSDEDMEMLLSPNPKAKSFIVDTFYGYYYTKPILEFLDNTYANIQNLTGYKKDLALAALGHTCKAKAVFGEFARSKKGLRQSITESTRYKSQDVKDKMARETSLGNIPLSSFVSTFRHYIRLLNSLVYDNGQENKVYSGEILDVIPRVKADLIYCDPPYITEFGANDYEGKYHFVEGLMTYWEGKDIQNNQRKSYPSRTKYNKESMAELFEKLITKARGHFPHILISYRDRAFPNQKEIAGMLKKAYRQVKVKSIGVEYGIVKYESQAGGKYAKELLFVASDPLKAKASVQASGQLIHTSFSVAIGVQAAADNGLNGDDYTGDKRFSFILCHAGTNRNGDHFTVEELSSRYQTAINKKIDLKHSQDITDIVGGVVSSDFVQDNQGSRVECIGELYTQDNDHARLAYKLIKKGIVTQVSMECDYQEGECSICGKRVKSKAEYCIHLKKYKGGEFNSQPVYEILHGITFTGLGLLDKKGADENARIKTVSQLNHNHGGEEMPEEKEKQELEKDGAKNDQTEDKDKDTLIKKLQAENQQLKQQVADLQKQVEKYEAEARATARKTRAEKLISKLDQKGLSFNDQDKEAEVKRLAELGDEAFAATEAAYDRMLNAEKKEPGTEDSKGKKESAKADSGEKKLRTDAGVTPLVVDDKKSTLEDRLKSGFMVAYQERVGACH